MQPARPQLPDPRQQGGQLGLNMPQQHVAGAAQQQQAVGQMVTQDLRTYTLGQQPGGALTMQQLHVQQLQPPAAPVPLQHAAPNGMLMHLPGLGGGMGALTGPNGPVGLGMPQQPAGAAPQHPSTAQTGSRSRWDNPGQEPPSSKRSRWDAPSSSNSSAGGAAPPPPPPAAVSAQQQQQPPPPPPGHGGQQQQQQQLPPPPPPWKQQPQQQQPPPPPPGNGQQRHGQQQQQPPPPSGRGWQQQQQQPPPAAQQQQQQPRQPRRKKQRQPDNNQLQPPPPPQQQQQQQQQPQQPQQPQQQQPPPPPPFGGQFTAGAMPGLQQPQGVPMHPGMPGLSGPPGAPGPLQLPPGAQPVIMQGPPGMQYVLQQQQPQQQQPGQYVQQQPQPGQQQVLVTYLPAGGAVGPPGVHSMGGVGVAGQQPGGGHAAAAAAGPGGPPPPPPVMPTMAVLLQAAGTRVQDLFLVLAELPRFLAATHASTLQEQDTVQVCQALLSALPEDEVLSQPLLNSPGIRTWYSTLRKAQPQLAADQQLLALECLAAMARAGCDPAPPDLTGALAAAVSDSNLMSDCAQFETAAQALMSLSSRAPESLAPCFERMLVDSVLRKVLKEDADQGCGVLIAVLVGLDRDKVPLSQKVQDSVSKFLQDSLPRLSPPTLAGLLACHTNLGLGNTIKLLRRTATEYQRRPEGSPSVDMLLGIMAGLVAGGKDCIRDLPVQLLTRLTEDLQGLLNKLQGLQLLKCITLLAQLGCIRSSKQQQFMDLLLQHLAQQQLQPDVLLQLPELINSLAEMEAAQSQPGLGALVKKLHGVQDSRGAVLQDAAAADVLRLVVGLQQKGKLGQGQQMLQELPSKVLASIRGLSEAVAAATASATTAAAAASAAGPEEQAEAVAEAVRLEQEQKQLLRVLSFQEWVSVIRIVKQLHTSTDGAVSILMPAGGEEIALLLQAMIDSELLHVRVQQVPALAPPPPAPGSSQQQGPRSAANGRRTPPPGAASSDGGGSAAVEKTQVMLLPMVFVAADWELLAQLLTECLEWYPLDLLPVQLLQLVLEVLEAQAALGGMTTCSTPSAVQMLWCLGIAGALSYELWDLLSGPLDNIANPLQSEQLMRVFEAYCLAVLRNSGPAPCEILMPQLMQAGQQFSSKVLKSGAQGRDKLLQALGNAKLVGAGARPTRVVDGHMMLCDMCITERKQAWVVTGIRTPLLSAAAGRLLSDAGWVQLQLSVKELDRTGSNPQSQAQRLVQLSQVADLLPRLSAMIRDHKAKQQLKQQQQKTDDQEANSDDDESDSDSDELDEDDMQQLMQLVQYLTSSLASGTLLQPLQDKQMAYLQHIAEQYTGQVQQQLPELPPLGAARAARQQRQQEAAAAALAQLQQQQRIKGPPWALDESTIDLSTVPPNSISIQDVFALNRNDPAAAAQDPGWYGLRLLAMPPEVQEGTAAAAAAAAAEAASQKAAAAAAFVINCRQAKAAAEAAAARAEAEAEAAAAACALQQQQEAEHGDGEAADALAGEAGRGRSPERGSAKRRRHWRDSRSRSRSCSVGSATSTSTRDSSRSSSGRSSGGSRGDGGSDSEEGALSEQGSEEGQVPEGDADEWARLYWERRQSRASADAATDGAGMAPVSFAARGVHQRPAYKQHQVQQQKQPLKRGRPRSRSRSRSRSKSPTGWGWGSSRQHNQQQYAGRYKRSSSSRSRSRSPGGTSSPTHKRQATASKWDATTSATPAGAAAAAAAGGAGAATGYGAAAAAGAAGVAASGYGYPGYSMAAMAGYSMQQQQAAAAMAAAAAAQQQQQQQLQYQFEGAAGQQKLLGLLSHMPAAQARLGELLQEGWFIASDIKQSAVVLMLQLDEAKMLSVLTELRSQLLAHEEKVKRKNAAAAAAAAGGDAAAIAAAAAAAAAGGGGNAEGVGYPLQHRARLHGGEVNGRLVNLCRQSGAKAAAKMTSAAAAGASASLAASAAAMRGMQGMYAGWSSYMAAAAAAAGGSNGAAGSAAAAGQAAAAGKASGSAAAAAAKGYGAVGGYMLMNGMLVPVPAQAAAALAARQGGYSFGGLAAAAGTGSGGAAAAAGGSAAGAAAAGGVAAGGAGGGQGQGSKKKSSYWDALYSGLDADLDEEGAGAEAAQEGPIDLTGES